MLLVRFQKTQLQTMQSTILPATPITINPIAMVTLQKREDNTILATPMATDNIFQEIMADMIPFHNKDKLLPSVPLEQILMPIRETLVSVSDSNALLLMSDMGGIQVIVILNVTTREHMSLVGLLCRLQMKRPE